MKLEKPCKIWRGTKNSNGYGVMNIGRKVMLIHRLEWLQYNDSITDDVQLNHHCDNKLCHEITHLYVGTQTENMQDFWNRTHPRTDNFAKGSAHPKTTLTESDVIHIKALLCDPNRNRTYDDIGEEYGVTKYVISDILNGRKWNHVPWPGKPVHTVVAASTAGADNPKAKLTEDDVRAIRVHLRERKFSQRKLAEMFRVTPMTINSIKMRRTWEHVD